MIKNIYRVVCYALFSLLILIVSCKKSKDVEPTNSSVIGLYQYEQEGTKRAYIIISKIGDLRINYRSIFDTGSAGMTIDAKNILPPSMVSNTGIKVNGDSVIVNGITVTSQASYVSYGDNTGLIKEYGNLAFASIIIGDGNGNTSIKRVPLFIYYKLFNATTNKEIASDHTLDVFGVGPGVSAANDFIDSPLNYYIPRSGYTSGFKLTTLNSSNFSSAGTYVSGLLTLGLNTDDLSGSGFIMHQLLPITFAGYSANIPAMITYNGQSVFTQVLFDTGTPTLSIIENKLAINSIGQLPANTKVTLKTNRGFVYSYLTSQVTNLTTIQNPNNTGDDRTIYSIDFFVHNEYLMDYANHQIGLKNN